MKNNLSVYLLLALSSQLFAADFASVYRAATENDSVFAEARAKLEAAQEKIPQGRAGLLPTVALSGNSMHNREDVEDRKLNTTSHWDYGSRSYTLSLTQPLFRWQNWVGYDQSKLVVAQAEAGFANARQDLILRTAQAYFDVLQARESLAAANAYKTAIASQLDIAREAFKIGTGVKTDIHDAETRFEMAASQAIAAESELEIKQRALESIAGQLPPKLAGKRNDARLSAPQPFELGHWLEAAEPISNGLTPVLQGWPGKISPCR
jgi:outer membrane protein